MKAVIMAGGKGTRLRPLTDRVPKPMVPVGPRRCIDYVLRSLSAAGVRDVIVTTGYLSEHVVRGIADGAAHGVSVVYSFEDEPLGTAGGVRHVGPFLGGETFIVASGDVLADVNIGDTITLASNPTDHRLPGYQPPQQMVFCDFYPGTGTTTDQLREAMEKLWLNDSSFTYTTVGSDALGIGFRCGFLGLLHMRIIQERVEREGNVTVVQTAPTVTYEIKLKDGSVTRIESPSELPEMSNIEEIREPFVTAQMIIPAESVGTVMQLSRDRRGRHVKTEYLSSTRVMMTYDFPLCEILYDFYDKLKSCTKGYGTADYHLKSYELGDMVKMDILVNGMPVDALSVIVHREKAMYRGRRLLERLKKQIDRHMFEIPLQAAIGSKVIARETIKAFRKDVTAKCYGGDITRKRKLLEKQKEGKKRMRTVGNVAIPQEAFMSILDPDED